MAQDIDQNRDIMGLARREEQHLLRELGKNPSYIKLQAVRAVIEAYGGQPSRTVMLASPPKPTPDTPPAPPSKSEQIVAAARAYLATNEGGEGRARSREILEVLQRQGITVGGIDPVANLAAHLSNSGQFQSHRRFGWRIKRPKDDAESGERRAPDDGNSSGARIEAGSVTQ